MTVIAALLTLVGYSMNDTIVIFDRIRENLKMSRREPLEQVMNRADQSDLEPDCHDFRFDVPDGDRPVCLAVRCCTDSLSRWCAELLSDVFFGVHRQSDRAVLAQLHG